MSEPKLYVSNLLPGTTAEVLTALFSPFGEVVDCVVMRSKGRDGRQSGFVKYATMEEAEASIASMDQYVPAGDTEPLTVRFAEKKAPAAAPAAAPVVQYIVAAPGYPPGAAPYIPLPPGAIPTALPSLPAGYAQPLIAAPTVGAKRPAEYVQPVAKRPRTDGPKPGAEAKLYVSNLEPHMDKDALYNLFIAYGNILETVVIKSKAGQRGRLSGFVKFADPQTATVAVATMDGCIPAGFTERITVKWAN
jgi:RNA recognition motif-containing protein